jgi:hypothetical protein
MGWVLILFVGVGGVAALVGCIFKWWGLLASLGLACFLAYAWEFDGEGLCYALIVGIVSSVAVLFGSIVRASLRR